jgi:hypothetical protein
MNVAARKILKKGFSGMRRGDSSRICCDATVFVKKNVLLDTSSGTAYRGHCLIANLVDGDDNYGAAVATACLEKTPSSIFRVSAGTRNPPSEIIDCNS